MRRLSLTRLLFLLPFFASAPAVAQPAPSVDVRHYDVTLRLLAAGESVAVDGRARVAVYLDAATEIGFDAVGFDVSLVEATGADSWDYDGRRLVVRWRSPQTGERLVTVHYRATPSSGVTREGGAVWSAFHTWHWMPTTIDPSERATIRLAVDPRELGEDWTVIATGDGPESPGPDIASRIPFPSYLYAFAVGPFAQLQGASDGVALRVWYPADSVPPTNVLAATAAALERWRDAFGASWVLDEYVQVLTPGRAAQEAAGMALISYRHEAGIAENPTEDWLVVHELAHQAWGNLVTCASWGDFWLNEAIVVWWVARDKARRGDPEGEAHERGLWRQRLVRAVIGGIDPRVHRPGSSVDDAGGPVVYSGGGLAVAGIADDLGAEVLEARLSGFIAAARAADGLALDTATFIDGLGLDPAARNRLACRLIDERTCPE